LPRGYLFDAVIAISGCDKTIPGTVMALARLDLPSLMLYGGSIAPGKFRGKNVAVGDIFEAVGAHAAGKISDADLAELENVVCPGPGACGGQYTANTMAMAFEMLGISPMGANGVPAMLDEKDGVAHRCGELVMDLLRRGVTACSIINRKSIEARSPASSLPADRPTPPPPRGGPPGGYPSPNFDAIGRRTRDRAVPATVSPDLCGRRAAGRQAAARR
jgi:dihydroxyacid dehydratase/phosphogluconate dehydratase